MRKNSKRAVGRKNGGKPEDLVATSKGCQVPGLEASIPVLNLLPFPVMAISPEHDIVWMNDAGAQLYDTGEGKCYTVSHGYGSPCNLHNEHCPKLMVEENGGGVSVLHVHHVRDRQESHKVVAIPLDGGFILEMHISIDEVNPLDVVTGLLGRTEAEQSVIRIFDLMTRMASNFALSILDVDQFRQVNDDHGHLCGDQLLKQVGRLLAHARNEADVLGRWRGDAFLLFLPNMDLHGASTIIEDILSRVRDAEFSIGSHKVQIKMSAGMRWVSGAEAGAANFENVLQDTEKMLSLAKQLGGNCLKTGTN